MKIKVAQLMSAIFNPLLILVFLPFFLVYKSTNNINAAFSWTGYTFMFLFAIAIFVLWAVRKKIFTNADVSVRSQRPLLFTVSLIIGLVYLLGLIVFHAPRILFVMNISMMIGILVVSAVNIKIKASIHVATVSALILGLALGFGGYYLLLLLFVPIMGWARVKLKRHTVSETVVGGVVGSLLLLGIYAFYEIFLNK